MEAFAQELRRNPSSDAGLLTRADETVVMLRDALKRGDRFAPNLPNPLPSPPSFTDPPGGRPGVGRVYFVTDYACFSSCLLMTSSFKARGAVHVGLPTDAATRYMESRQVALPSALAGFSTLQKVALRAPAKIGPFEPNQRFVGDMRDTKALEAWIQQLATHN